MSYVEDRRSFLSTARKIGTEHYSYLIPNTFGANGEELAIDVALIGSRNASKAIVITSGIHGVELPFGSQMQREWLSAAVNLCNPHKDVRVVMVHALNPFGASYGLRTDQCNIDINRNFIDFNKPLPVSVKYADLAEAFLPKSVNWNPDLAQSWKSIFTYGLFTHSVGEFIQALAGGQYQFADGLYYGGTEPSWTHKTWNKIVKAHVASNYLKELWHVDIHTGDGPRGMLQILANTEKDSPLHRRLQDLGMKDKLCLTSETLAQLTGDITDHWQSTGLNSNVIVTPMTVEIGTRRLPKGIDVLHTMMVRNCLQQRHQDKHSRSQQIIADMRETFYPQDPLWQRGAKEQAGVFWKKLKSTVVAGL